MGAGLNLLGEGLRLSSELNGHGSGLDAASAALREVQSQVDAAQTSVTAFAPRKRCQV